MSVSMAKEPSNLPYSSIKAFAETKTNVFPCSLLTSKPHTPNRRLFSEAIPVACIYQAGPRKQGDVGHADHFFYGVSKLEICFDWQKLFLNFH